MISIDEARRLVAENSVPEPNTGCLLWLRGVNPAGYAIAHTKGGRKHSKTFLVTRALLGLTEPHIQACHRCDTPLCVNEDHLFVGTQRDNIGDMMRKGRGRGQFASPSHCKHGHEFTPDNTRVLRNGERECIACRVETQRRYHERHRQKLNAKRRERYHRGLK